ncbi:MULTISPECIES: heavy metal translocating P-type ATPase [unclassified Methylibium]|uniref:heavy metal translocating P-type ATPase n=1 Tax=unclassified Methylibium TaxID=2633235 RepID=UPI0003F3F1D0|nr:MULTISPECIES: heavy metal translocating P-type ATPase [unclassified Methylibium]EWS56591.1 putative cadmium-transporting ATPase [Methylibium sp. T29]EWS61542.1 putative cadmium-transporting ATPase [Methylibium sp. T29-B]
MDCAAEESEIRRAVEGISGIRALTFQLGQRSLALDAPGPALELAVAAIRKAGFDPQPLAEGKPGAAPEHAADDGHDHGQDHAFGPVGYGRLGMALLLAIAAELVGYFAPDTQIWKGIGLAVAAAAIWLAGFDVYKKGLTALLRGRLNINALMTVAVTGAFAIGQWPEAAMVMALYAIAEAIEARAVDRARNAIKGLLEMAPEEAAVRQADGTWLTQPVASVALDAVLQVRPGERVPMDGVLTAGSTSINQAPVTGESIPVDKAVGDPVFAGTINDTGSFEFRVTALASNSTLARIIHAVEEAQGTRAPTQGFVDRFAAVYTPAVFVVALAVALLGPWLLDWTWMQSIYKALVLLVIACPCALVISTPVTIVSGLAAAARRGILIKGGVYLEGARNLKAIALDKTGTITEGKPKLVEWKVLDTAMAAGMDAATAEHTAAVLAGHSDHPVSRAIAAGLKSNSVQAKDFKAIAGRGVQAEIGGKLWVLGNHKLIEERGQCSPALEAVLRTHEEAGRTVSLLASDTGPVALFAVADTIKPSSREAVAELKALGITPVMLTGDNQATATAIAHEAGIAEARGNLLPEDKLAAIKALQAEHGMTAMTGDGINDAPALAQSDIGVAMGAAGTDTAMEAADVVVMNDDLRRIAETVRLSKFTHAVLWQNIALALGIKAVFLVLAVFGNASMWMAVFADMGASLLVVVNGLRLLKAGVQSR